MLPCRFYALNTGKEGFKCEFEEQESSLFLRYKDNKDFIVSNWLMRHFANFAMQML